MLLVPDIRERIKRLYYRKAIAIGLLNVRVSMMMKLLLLEPEELLICRMQSFKMTNWFTTYLKGKFF